MTNKNRWVFGAIGCLVVGVVLAWWSTRNSPDPQLVRLGTSVQEPVPEVMAPGDLQGDDRVLLSALLIDEEDRSSDIAADQTRWLPSYPSKSLEGMNGEEVLADYWGASWPEVKEHLLTNMGVRSDVEKMMSQWHSTGDHQSGDLDLFLKELPRLLKVAYERGRSTSLRTSRVVYLRCLPPPPFGQAFEARQFLTPGIESAIDHVGNSESASNDVDAIAGRILDRHKDAIQSSLDELAALALELEEQLERAFLDDIRNVSPTEYPLRGELFVSPVMSTGARGPRTLAGPTSGDVLRLSCGSGSSSLGGVFSATYTLDLRLIQELASTLTLVDASQRRLVEWVDALIGVEVR